MFTDSSGPWEAKTVKTLSEPIGDLGDEAGTRVSNMQVAYLRPQKLTDERQMEGADKAKPMIGTGRNSQGETVTQDCGEFQS